MYLTAMALIVANSGVWLHNIAALFKILCA